MDDGVVDYESAHMDDAVSEVVVASEHQSIHRNPKAILEVRRILLEHLGDVRDEYRTAQQYQGLQIVGDPVQRPQPGSDNTIPARLTAGTLAP